MKKLQQNHRSPKCVSSISLDKTPSVVGGRVEMFGNIADMICQWEGMEEEEGKSKDNYLSTATGIVIASTDRPGWKSSQAGRPGSDPETGGDGERRGRKRLSKVIRKLSGKFEKGEEEEPHSQPGGDISVKGGRGTYEQNLSRKDMTLTSFDDNGLGRKTKEGIAVVNNAFSNSVIISTNKRSRSQICVSTSRLNVSNQSKADRKRKADESEVNPVQRASKQIRFNSECNSFV